jgi:putative transcriptional regulator
MNQIKHHPDVETLAAFAFGTLDKGQAFVVAAHVCLCQGCRSLVSGYEETAGVLLEQEEPATMSMAAADRTLDAVLHGPGGMRRSADASADVDLRTTLTTFRDGPWRWVGPGVHVRVLAPPAKGETRLFLLKAEPGTSLPDHTHSGQELTLVLQGAFAHEGGRFAVGDVEEADGSVAHQPVVEDGESCICLVAMDGRLRLKGIIGRVLQPFVRL